MEINRSSSGGSATSLGAPSTDPTRSDLGPEAFMRLLVTQIRNQDPLSPMDTRDMMAQLTQLTSVERLVAIDGRLQSLQVASAAMANTQAVYLVGTIVEADTSQVMLGELGAAQGSFQLEGAASEIAVQIRNESGELIRTLSLGGAAAGQRSFEWDGNDEAGQRVSPGRYSIQVEARDGGGSEVTTLLRTRGPVRAVTYQQGYPSLSIGETDVMMGDVRQIEGAPSSSPAP